MVEKDSVSKRFWTMFRSPKRKPSPLEMSINDIEMLQAVGTGIAMDNASQDVKAVADVICGSVREEEIYRYCKENHLI